MGACVEIIYDVTPHWMSKNDLENLIKCDKIVLAWCYQKDCRIHFKFVYNNSMLEFFEEIELLSDKKIRRYAKKCIKCISVMSNDSTSDLEFACSFNRLIEKLKKLMKRFESEPAKLPLGQTEEWKGTPKMIYTKFYHLKHVYDLIAMSRSNII